jgi:hypothetical protein
VHTRVDPTPAPEPSRAAPKPAPSTDLLALRRTHQAVRSLLRQPSPLAAGRDSRRSDEWEAIAQRLTRARDPELTVRARAWLAGEP